MRVEKKRKRTRTRKKNLIVQTSRTLFGGIFFIFSEEMADANDGGGGVYILGRIRLIRLHRRKQPQSFHVKRDSLKERPIRMKAENSLIC